MKQGSMIRLMAWTIVLLLSATAAARGDEAKPLEVVSGKEAMEYGRIIYRDGILPDGSPVEAVVQGDIPVDGRMFTCVHCHQRSGLGSVEGTVITPRTNGKDLYRPWRRTGAWRQPEDEKRRHAGRGSLPPQFRVEDNRPAYDRETLVKAIAEGEDSNGRDLNPVMPRYRLDRRNMGYLIYYLENLSSTISPGVSDSTIRFATVITEGVPEKDRDAMLSVLKAIVEDRNRQSRHQEKRAEKGPFFRSEKNEAFRNAELDVWELKGPRSEWRAQLEKYYAAKPVFALLGGMAAGDWAPMHEFCETLAIPCIMPLTDRPVISKTDWYTLYFSKGFYQEGETAARFLLGRSDIGKDAPVVQIFRKGDDGALAAEGFRAVWEEEGRGRPDEIILQAGDSAETTLREMLGRPAVPRVVLYWMKKQDMAALAAYVAEGKEKNLIFISATLVGEDFTTIPRPVAPDLFITYPLEPEQDRGRHMTAVENWLNVRNIPITSKTIHSKMYFLGWTLAHALGMMRNDFYREYFLEGFDMMVDQTYAIAVYPRLSFGPGQRYMAKGCYVARLAGGPESSALVKQSDWVMY